MHFILRGGNITAAVTLKILAHNQQLATKIIPTATLSSTSTDSITDTISMTPHQMKPRNPLDSILPMPIGLILIYPALDFEMSCWMSSSQLSLIRAESNTTLFRSSSLDSLWQTKDHLSHVSPLSVVPDLEKKQSLWRRALGLKPTLKQRMADRAHPIRDQIQTKEAWATARLAMTSRMSFFNDRVITPDLVSCHSNDFKDTLTNQCLYADESNGYL